MFCPLFIFIFPCLNSELDSLLAFLNRECQIFHKKSKNKPTAAGILFPTCISVNSRFCFVSPHSTDDTTLAPNDIIKM